MNIQMNLDGIEIPGHGQGHAQGDAAEQKPATFKSVLMSVVAIVLALVLGAIGLMMGLTLMLVGLGLAPIAAIWLWYVMRRSSEQAGSIVINQSDVVTEKPEATVSSETVAR